MTVRFVGVILLGVLLTACDPLVAFEPMVTTAPDEFALEATEVTSVTSTVSYGWVHGGTRALVNHSTTTTSAGCASIRVYDAEGALVYSRALMPSLLQETTLGVAGTWTIEVTMTGYTGTLRFKLQSL